MFTELNLEYNISSDINAYNSQIMFIYNSILFIDWSNK